MAAPRTGTRERILNAAETLFASRGYDGTSTRDVVAASGDTIGSVNYHFGSKDQLLRAVVDRRWSEIAQARREAYAEAAAAGDGQPSIDAVVRCVVLPYLERCLAGDAAWRSYALLQAQILHTPEAYRRVLQDVSEPASREILEWMAAALPGVRKEDIGYAFQFMVGAMAETAAQATVKRLERITDGACSSTDFEAISVRLVPFIVAGVKAVCG